VLTLTNVTAFRASLEQAIYDREYTKAIINTLIDPVVVLDEDHRVQTANQSFHALFQVPREQVQGVRLYELGNLSWDLPRLQRFLEETRISSQVDPIEFEQKFPAIGPRRVLLNARRLSREGKLGQMILLTIQDITERVRSEQEREKLLEQLKKSQDNLVSKVADLELFHDVAVGRELKLMELEREIVRLRLLSGEHQPK
jgi:PAS domain S-box-containing protein